MTDFVVTDSRSGRKLKISGDSPPSESELEEIFSSLRVTKLGDLDPRAGLVDAVVSAGSSFAGTVAGGLTGLITFIGTGGNVEAATSVQGEVQNRIAKEPQTNFAKEVLSGAQSAAEFTSGVGSNAAANILDAINFKNPQREGQGRNTDQIPSDNFSLSVRDNGLSEALGDVVFEHLGPASGAVARTLPEALALLAGTRAPLSKTSSGTRVDQRTGTSPNAPEIRFELNSEPQVSVGRPTLDSPVDITPIAPQAKTIAENIKRDRQADVARTVRPDSQVLRDAQDLGIDLNPEHYSTNKAFQDVSRAIKAKSGSRLEAREREAIIAVGNRADDLISDIGGQSDKATLSAEIGEELGTAINDLSEQASFAYDRVNEAIPKAARVQIDGVRGYIQNKLNELGGDKSLLSTAEKRLLNLDRTKKTTVGGIQVEEFIPPTYAALDRIRKDVGNGFNRRSGPFRDDSDGTLRQVYRVLSDDQQNAAAAFGLGDVYTAARSLVSRRKGLEDQATELFGRNLSGSIVPKMKSAANALTRGDVSRFNQLMNALPEGRRAEVAASLLNDIFTTGSRSGGSVGQGFVNAFASLNRSPEAKSILFRDLPNGARDRFDKIGRVYSAIIRSNQKSLANPSGSAGPILKALEDPTWIEKIYDVGRKAAVAETATAVVGAPGVGTAGVLGGVFASKKTPVIVAADEMLSSPAFSRAVRETGESGAEQANRVIQSSPQFKRWAALNPRAAKQIASIGFLQWLTQDK